MGFPRRSRSIPSRRHNLLEGLDDIATTLKHADKISAYEATHVLPSI